MVLHYTALYSQRLWRHARYIALSTLFFGILWLLQQANSLHSLLFRLLTMSNGTFNHLMTPIKFASPSINLPLRWTPTCRSKYVQSQRSLFPTARLKSMSIGMLIRSSKSFISETHLRVCSKVQCLAGLYCYRTREHISPSISGLHFNVDPHSVPLDAIFRISFPDLNSSQSNFTQTPPPPSWPVCDVGLSVYITYSSHGVYHTEECRPVLGGPWTDFDEIWNEKHAGGSHRLPSLHFPTLSTLSRDSDASRT
jgi:hypothetical protein